MIKLTQFKRYDLCYFKSRTCLLQLLLAGTLQIMNITYYFQAYIPSIKLLVNSHVMLSTSEKTTIRSVGAHITYNVWGDHTNYFVYGLGRAVASGVKGGDDYMDILVLDTW